MAGKEIRLPLPQDNPVGGTATSPGTDHHPEDHDKIREILAVLVDGFVPDKLGDLADVNTDNVGDGIGSGYVLAWDGGKFLPVTLPTPVTGAIVSGATLRLQYPDGTFTDVLLPVNTGPSGPAGTAGRGLSGLTIAQSGTESHLFATYTDDPNNAVDLGLLPRGLPGTSGANGADGRSAVSAAVNPAGRLILTYSDGTTVDAGSVVGPAGVGSFADSFRGMYSATTTYAKNDIVSSGGDTYFSRIDANTGNTPVPDQTSAQWAILALNGAKGDMGAQGPIGATPALSVGTVSTVDSDQPAAATFTGTPAAPLLNLSLPRGPIGVTGARGVDGAAGAPGTPGNPGRGISAVTLSATNVLTVTYTDTTTTTVGTIATVKGDTGATGATGPAGPTGAAGTPGTAGATGATGAAGPAGTAGAAGKDGVSPQLAIGTVTTLATGQPGTASVTGTAPNYVLNLGLPVASPAAATQVRGVYSTANSYAVGDVVSYQSVLYQATAAVAAGTPFPAASFTALTATTLPAATAVGQVLTATSTAVGGYAFATFAPPGLHRGAWTQGLAYAVGDVVGFAGNTYQATAAAAAGAADTLTSATNGAGFRNNLTSVLTGLTVSAGSPSISGSGVTFANGTSGQGFAYVRDPSLTSPAGTTFSITLAATTRQDFQYVNVGAPLTNTGNTDNGDTGSTVGAYLQFMYSTGGWALRRNTAGATSAYTTVASGTFLGSVAKGALLAVTFAFDSTGALTLSVSVAGGTTTVLTTQPSSLVTGMSFGTSGIAYGFGQSYADGNNNGVPYRSNLQVFGGTSLPATVDPLTVLVPPAASFAQVGGLPTPPAAGRVLKSTGTYPGALNWVSAVDVPTPTATGQVLTATGATAGAYAFAAPVTPPGTFRGVWSTTATYAVGDVVSYQAQLYQATAASTNQATFPTASFTQLTSGIPTPPQAGRVLASTGSVDGAVGWSPTVSAVAGAWTTLPAAGAATAHATRVPQYRVIGDIVELRGGFNAVTATASTVTPFATLPAGVRPAVDTISMAFTTQGNTSVGVNVGPDGSVSVYNGAALSSATVFLDGLRFSLTSGTGQPAYSSTFLTTQPTAWTTLAPTAGTQSTPPLQYRLNGDRVELRGYVAQITAAANTISGTIATLPVGFRPVTGETSVPAVSPSAGRTGSVTILTTGELRWFGSALSGELVSFNGVTFSVSLTNTAAPTGVVGSAWTALPLAGAATAGNSAPQYRTVGDEVQLRGFVSNVTVAANALLTIATLPVGFRPAAEQSFSTLNVAAGNLTGCGVKADGTVYVYGPTALSAASVAVAPIRFSTTV